MQEQTTGYGLQAAGGDRRAPFAIARGRPSAEGALLRLDRVSKVLCASFELGRTYGIRDIFSRRRRDIERLRRGEFLALRSVSLSVRPGEHVLVLGTPSSGKTTLAKLMTGVMRPDAGGIERAGRAALVGGGKLGMNPYMTAWEYLQLATAMRGVPPDRAQQTCQEILDVTGLAGSRNVPVVDLSQTALKYLMLGAMLSVTPDLYVFDGLPSSGGDPVGDRLNARLNDILSRETTVVLTSSARKLPPYTDRVLILHAGELLYEGSPEIAVPIYEKFARMLQQREDGTWRVGRSRETVSANGAAVQGATTPAAALIRWIARHQDDSLYVAALEDDLQRAWNDGRPVVLGPYTSDVGFELLYWIPFLAWMRERFGRPGQPVVAVSRGRVGDWYRSVTDRYVDAFDLMSEAQFHRRHRDRAARQDDPMQGSLSEFERDVLRGVIERLGLQDPGLVHPSGLSWLGSKVARGKLPLSVVTERALYRRLAPPTAAGPLAGFPAEYVVAGCWFGSGFPNTPEHRAVIGALVSAASRRAPVILLDAKGVPDEERQRWDGGAGVTTFETFNLGEQRLATLSRVIAGSRAFVGTFGGRSCLAPFHGVPSCMVHGELSGQARLQAAVAAHAFASLEGGPAITRPAGEITQAAANSLIDRILGRGAE